MRTGMNRLEEKNEARKEKLADKEKADTDKYVIVMSADTEALLIAPHNNSSLMYYRNKLNVHNVTCRDSTTGTALNYMWTEVEGGLDSSVFVSIHIDYLKERLE